MRMTPSAASATAATPKVNGAATAQYAGPSGVHFLTSPCRRFPCALNTSPVFAVQQRQPSVGCDPRVERSCQPVVDTAAGVSFRRRACLPIRVRMSLLVDPRAGDPPRALR